MASKKRRSSRLDFFQQHTFTDQILGPSEIDGVNIYPSSPNEVNQGTISKQTKRARKAKFSLQESVQHEGLDANLQVVNARRDVATDVVQVPQHCNEDFNQDKFPTARGQTIYQRNRGGVTVEYSDVGDNDFLCSHCYAHFWLGEANKQKNKNTPLIYTGCCKNEAVFLPQLKPTPPFLDALLNPINGRESSLFRQNVRVYNSMFSFTSMGANIDNNINNDGSGPYVFKISGQVYHRMGSILPAEGKPPTYAQLYIYDTHNEVSNRMTAIDPTHSNINLKTSVVSGLIEMLDEHNVLSRIYRDAKDKYVTQSLPSFNIDILTSKSYEDKQYEQPIVDEIGGLIVGDIGEFNSNKDVIIESNDGHLRRISKIHPKFMSLQYPLLFPFGEDGYKLNLHMRPSSSTYQNIDEESKKGNISMRSFIVYHLHDRNGNMNTLLKGGRLFQQYLVDAYATVDEHRLDYIRQHQDTIRTVKCDELFSAVSTGAKTSYDVGQRIILPGSHTGSPRDMINNYHDAMAICRQYGNPDLFITFTCNPNWPEILRFFQKYPGYQQEDRPDIISRIFEIKLKDMISYIKSGEPFGQIQAYVHRVEFQKRGLPHSHMLFWLKNEFKCYTSNDIDSIISAELPDKNYHPILFDLVGQFMIHGPCGEINFKSPCMHEKKCSKFFPKSYNDATAFDNINAPIYRRRNDNTKFVTKKGIEIGNDFVVPYNANLLLKYKAHINVELCSQSMVIKYLFKYINKGPDRARVLLYENKHDEIQTYLNCRYLTPHESVWRLFEFSIHSRYPAVQHLVVHLPSEQNITFKESDTLESLVDYRANQRTTLTGWFKANNEFEEAKELTYPQFPMKFVRNQRDKEWTRRKRYETIGRMAYVSPMQTERYYLRMLLNIQKGCINYKAIKTINGTTYPSYQDACRALGLLGDDNEWVDALTTASFVATGYQLRQLFATIMLFCNVADPKKLFDLHWSSMCEDIVHKIRRQLADPTLQVPQYELQNKLLYELEKILNISSRSLKDYQLPMPDLTKTTYFENKLLREELNFDQDLLRVQHTDLVIQLNTSQRKIYDHVIKIVDNKQSATLFVHGSGGTGKTFLWSTIMSKIRSEGKIVLAVASSGVASLLLPNGRTAHSRFKIPLDIDAKPTLSINKGTNLANLLKQTELIIWDEAPMSKKHCFESLDLCLRDVLSDSTDSRKNVPFGGKPILLGGDFRQILPVITGKGKEAIIDATLNFSYLWPSFTIFSLEENMRLTKFGLTDKEKKEISEFSEWTLAVGEGKLKSVYETDDQDTSWIEIPETLLIKSLINPIEAIFVSTYPDFVTNYNNVDYLRERAILTPRNTTVHEINNYILNLLPTEKNTYLSSDTISHNFENNENIDLLYPTEFLNQLEFSGLPSHELILKVNMPIMLLRNIDQVCGLCNGTRLIITRLFKRLIEAEILTGNNIGRKVYIPRIVLTANETKWPFTFKRRQFPVKPCYAMTINKSQGQSLNQVGVYLPEPVFSHGQLYVAISRVTSKDHLKILINNTENIPNKYTKNIVFKDIFHNL